MSLPIFQTSDRNLSMLQTQWASQLNPLLIKTLPNGIQLKDIKLTTGSNKINTLLGEKYQGYVITGMRGGFSQVYELPTDNAELFLMLNSSAVVTIDLWVY